MSAHQSVVETTVNFVFDEPVTVTRSYDGSKIVGRRVEFRSYASGPDAPTPNFEYGCATLFTKDNDNAQFATQDGSRWIPALPDWCPKPPEGWDSHVRAFQDTLKEET